MRLGKISENVLKRSVLKKIKNHREETVSGAGIGKDCAILAFNSDCGSDYEIVTATTSVTAPVTELARYAVTMAVNNVAIAAAEPVGVMLSLLLPENEEETSLQAIMTQAEQVCEEQNVEILGGHTEVTPVVTQAVLNVTAFGKKEAARAGYPQRITANQDIVVSKWIGLEGTVRLAKEHKDKLCTRYPVRMIEEAEGFMQYLSVIPEAATAIKSGVCGIHDVSRGGIFGALWEMASGAGVGLEIDLKKLPIKQETVEICEFFEVNPYELLSGGCLIMVTPDGNGLVEKLARENIPATVVGRTTEGNDRVIYNEEEKRFLDMPKTDQIYLVKEK